MSVDRQNEKYLWCDIHHIWYTDLCSICIGEDIEESSRQEDGK